MMSPKIPNSPLFYLATDFSPVLPISIKHNASRIPSQHSLNDARNHHIEPEPSPQIYIVRLPSPAAATCRGQNRVTIRSHFQHNRSSTAHPEMTSPFSHSFSSLMPIVANLRMGHTIYKNSSSKSTHIQFNTHILPHFDSSKQLECPNTKRKQRSLLNPNVKVPQRDQSSKPYLSLQSLLPNPLLPISSRQRPHK